MSEHAPRATKAARSADTLISLGMGVLFVLAVGVGALTHGHPVAGLLLVAAAAGGAALARNASFSGPCPHCGARIDELGEGAAKRCPRCLLYSARRGDVLAPLGASGAAGATFDIPLPPAGGLKSPSVCWCCGAPALAMKTVRGSVDFSTNPAVKAGRSYAVDVSDCGRHDLAPVIRLAADSAAGEGLRRVGAVARDAGSSAYAALTVSDYRFYVEFLRLNGFLLPDGDLRAP